LDPLGSVNHACAQWSSKGRTAPTYGEVTKRKPKGQSNKGAIFICKLCDTGYNKHYFIT